MLDFFGKLNWIDFVVIIVLAGGAFAGFQQGFIRYALSWLTLVVAFIVSAQLKGPLTDALSNFWTAFDPPVREFWVFVVLFVGLAIGGWFLVRAFYRTTRLPIIRQVDELLGAILGVVFAATAIVLLLVVFDTLFKSGVVASGQSGLRESETGWLKAFYNAMNDSVLVGVFRRSVLPVVGFLARIFLPSDIAQYLRR
jgi:uncharacterized membrane protein required for colicin V production